MATREDALLLSLDSYNDDPQAGGGWRRIADRSDRDSGLFAAAYARGNEIVVAFRGWDGLDPLDVPNIARAYDGDPFQQIADAEAFLEDITAANPNARISLTGHSLGGALAAILAARNGLEAQTFAGIESVGPALDSMDGYDFDPFGITLWEIDQAAANLNITRQQLAGYGDVVNHVLYGDVATYIDRTVPLAGQIGQDRVYARAIAEGRLADDSLFGRYRNVYGEAFTAIVPADPQGVPYDTAFQTQLHSLGFHALELTFGATLDRLWIVLPRLALQLTNDLLGSDRENKAAHQVTYDFLDQAMLDHLSAPGRLSVASAMIEDFQDIASAGPRGIARANPDINTAFLQLAIEYASVQTLGGDAEGRVGGIVTDRDNDLSVNLGSTWGVSFAPEGARLIRDYADHLLRGVISGAADGARTLFADASNGAGANIEGSAEADLIFGGPGEDNLSGGGGADVIFGLGGADALVGDAGADVLSGSRGNDWLVGRDGADSLIGGPGADTLIGGDDRDSLVFNRIGNGPDLVDDFAPGIDSLLLQNAVFAGLGPAGPLAAGRLAFGAAAQDADDRLVYNAATGALFFDPDGSAPAPQTRIGTLAGGPALTAADIEVI